MSYEAVLFDMNGVLIDDEPLHEQAFRKALHHIGLPLSADDYKRYFIGRTDQQGLEEYLQARNIRIPAAPLASAKSDEYQTLTAVGAPGYEGVEECLQAFASHGFLLGVVTSSTQAEARTVLRGLQLADYFQTVVVAEDVQNGKPAPEGYLRGAKDLMTRPPHCIVIEDAPSGLQAAQAAGMFAVAVTNTHAASELAQADLVVDALSADLVHTFTQ